MNSTSKIISGFENGCIDTAALIGKTSVGKMRPSFSGTKIDRVPKKVAGNIIKKSWCNKNGRNKDLMEQFPNTMRLDS